MAVCNNCIYGRMEKGFPACFVRGDMCFHIKYTNHKVMAFSLNAFCDCYYYKRKWWKFWV